MTLNSSLFLPPNSILFYRSFWTEIVHSSPFPSDSRTICAFLEASMPRNYWHYWSEVFILFLAPRAAIVEWSHHGLFKDGGNVLLCFILVCTLQCVLTQIKMAVISLLGLKKLCVGGQFLGVSSLLPLPPCEIWELNSGSQAYIQVPLSGPSP